MVVLADHKARVLIVDDEPDITSVMKRGLQNAGYAVDAFNDPEQALANFKSEYYDMLIFDIRMSKINGFQLYREVRKKDSNAKVCFMTAFEVYRKEFEKMFPDFDIKCFLTKPLSIRDLQKIVEAELERK
jgi:two-component system catabolic regulation response regulator CreB/two-component system response regulator ChvI